MASQWHSNIQLLEFKALINQLQQHVADDMESTVTMLGSFRSLVMDPDVLVLSPNDYMEKLLKICIVEEALIQSFKFIKNPNLSKDIDFSTVFENIVEHFTTPAVYDICVKSYELALMLAPLANTSQSILRRKNQPLTLEQSASTMLLNVSLHWMNRSRNHRLETCLYKDIMYQSCFSTGDAWQELDDPVSYVKTISEYSLPLAFRLRMPIQDLRFNTLLQMGYEAKSAECFQQLCLQWNKLLQEPCIDLLRIEDTDIQSNYTY